MTKPSSLIYSPVNKPLVFFFLAEPRHTVCRSLWVSCTLKPVSQPGLNP